MDFVSCRARSLASANRERDQFAKEYCRLILVAALERRAAEFFAAVELGFYFGGMIRFHELGLGACCGMPQIAGNRSAW